jgi:para-nitrobenzyl esterase
MESRLSEPEQTARQSRPGPASWRPSKRKLAWVARHGKPEHEGMPAWPAYTLDQRATMLFTADDSHTENDPLREARLKYLSLPAAGPPARGRG